jgi:hypothetical protein
MTHPSDNQPRRAGKFAERHRNDADDTLPGEWRHQVVTVMGRAFQLSEVSGGQLFHGSRHRLAVGTVLEPGHNRNFVQSSTDTVSITSEPGRAQHWAEQSGAGPHFIYEVEPLGAVDVWRAGLADQGQSFRLFEARVPQARIVALYSADSTVTRPPRP